MAHYQSPAQSDTDGRKSKDEMFSVLASGKYECAICRRRLASKQRILLHLAEIHGLCKY